MIVPTRYLICVLCLAALLGGPVLAGAQDDKAKSMFERGQFELVDGYHKSSLYFFDQAISLDAENAEYHVYRGMALYKMGRRSDADASFKYLDNVRPVSKRGSVAVELAAMYARDKNWTRGAEYYGKALESLPGRADLYLARGDMYLELGRYDLASKDYETAAQKDSTQQAAAQYHLALISYRQEDFDTTKKQLDRALEFNPSEGMAGQIRQFKHTVIKEENSYKPWEATVAAMMEYDDNIPLEPNDGWASFGVTPTDSEDFSFGILAQGTYYLLNSRNRKLGLDYTFRGQFYKELTEYDQMAHNLGAYYFLGMKPWYFRIRANFGYYYTDGDPVQAVYSLVPSMTYLWTDKDRTEFMALLAYKSKKDDTDDVNRYVLNGTHYHTFRPPADEGSVGLTARGGLSLEHEKPDGSLGYEYMLYDLRAGVAFPIWGKLYGDLGLSHAWAYFEENPVLTPGIEREDTRLILQAKMGYVFNDCYRLDFQWIRTYNDSNLENAAGVDLYEFRRNVYSLMFTGRF